MLSSLIVLLLIKGGGFSTAFGTEQLQALAGLTLDIRWAAFSIVFVFLGLGSIVFFYLFFKSNYIPRILAGFGIFSFLLLFIYPFVDILLPNYAGTIQIVCFVPAALFEIIIGLWLVLKGVKLTAAS